jgi:hypothetical protein
MKVVWTSGEVETGPKTFWIVFSPIPQTLSGLKKPERNSENLITNHFMCAPVRNTNLWAPMKLIIVSRYQA